MRPDLHPLCGRSLVLLSKTHGMATNFRAWQKLRETDKHATTFDVRKAAHSWHVATEQRFHPCGIDIVIVSVIVRHGHGA